MIYKHLLLLLNSCVNREQLYAYDMPALVYVFSVNMIQEQYTNQRQVPQSCSLYISGWCLPKSICNFARFLSYSSSCFFNSNAYSGSSFSCTNGIGYNNVTQCLHCLPVNCLPVNCLPVNCLPVNCLQVNTQCMKVSVGSQGTRYKQSHSFKCHEGGQG